MEASMFFFHFACRKCWGEKRQITTFKPSQTQHRYHYHKPFSTISMCVSFPPCRRRWRPVRPVSQTWSYSSSSSKWCSSKAWRTPRRVPCSASSSTSFSPSWRSSWYSYPPCLTACRPWWRRAAAPSPRSSSSSSSPCCGGTGTHSQDTHFSFCTCRDDADAARDAAPWCFEYREATATNRQPSKFICEYRLPFWKEKVYTFTFWKYELIKSQPFLAAPLLLGCCDKEWTIFHQFITNFVFIS